MKLKLLTAVAALVACSGVWAEVIYLDCKNDKSIPDSDHRDGRSFVIDMNRRTASIHTKNGYTFPAEKVIIDPGLVQITWGYRSEENPGFAHFISRVDLSYRTTFAGPYEEGQCTLVENPDLKF
jgi:hypothetical protein